MVCLQWRSTNKLYNVNFALSLYILNFIAQAICVSEYPCVVQRSRPRFVKCSSWRFTRPFQIRLYLNSSESLLVIDATRRCLVNRLP